ncbi:MAG: hypothetical protein HQL51_14515 [Magnetococcales bacterium]|nr:hypothetical protein [Magnetococcales bacterium]
MDEFLTRNRSLVVSTLYLMVGLLLAGYSIYYTRVQAYGEDLKLAMNQAAEANKGLTEKIQGAQKEGKDSDQGVRYLPTFLMRINQIAKNNQVIIKRLTPEGKEGSGSKFLLELQTDYYTLVKFTAELESLDVVLDDFQVHPFDNTKSPPIHAISFSIVPRNDAAELTGKRLEELTTWVKTPNRRNPFQRFAYNKNQQTVESVIDLTWILKLGGIGDGPDGKPYATINRQNYNEGDQIEGRTVQKIQPDRVYLEKKTPEGSTVKFVLKFRKSAGGAAGGPSAPPGVGSGLR